jgi:DNA-binding SARP family transcriptional activator/ATP/maltotriose-dependent transcriptional regulator MalT
LRDLLVDDRTRWYTIDERDTDPRRLGDELSATWAEPDVARLILDDAHLLLGSGGLGVVRDLIAALPEGRQLVVSANRDLGLVDDRTRGLGLVAEVDARDLALDLHVVADIVSHELTPDRALAARIADATGGWPVGVRLAVEALRDLPESDRSAAVERLIGTTGAIGRYLRRVVASDQDREVHELLARLYLLQGASAERLARLAGGRPAEQDERLERLLRRGLARPRPEDPATVELPPAVDRLVADHLLPELDRDSDLVAEVTEQLLANGEVAVALDALTSAARSEAVARLLQTHGRALIHAGHLRTVARSVERLPNELRSPAVESLQAEALAFRGEWAQALRCLESIGPDDGGPLPTERATQLGLIHHTRGDLDAAVAAYLRGPDDEDSPAFAGLLGWRATAHWLRGQLEDARCCADRAMDIATRHNDDRALAYAHTAAALVAASDGDRRANLSHYRQALAAASRGGDQLQQARILTNLGSHHLEEGRYADALEVTGEAIDLAEAQGFATLIGVARCNRSEALLSTGATDEAIADAERAREVFARIGARTEAYAHHVLAAARAERGELALARQAYEQALRLGTPGGDRQALVPAHLGLSWVLTGTDHDAAAAAIERARELDDGMAAAEVAAADAWVHLARGETAVAAELAEAAEGLATSRGNRAVAANAMTCRALTVTDPRPLLTEALALWQELEAPLWVTRLELALERRAPGGGDRARVGELERRLAALGCPLERSVWAAQVLTGSDRTGRSVIRALGTFSASVDGQPVTASSWGSRKARELVKALIARSPRGLTREELGHLLWPDQPYDKVSGRLSTALSLARTALVGDDGDRDASPIESEGSTVRLAVERIEVDALSFRQLAESGLRAVRDGQPRTATRLLLEAEELYGGDLFEDDPDLPWAEDRRAELRSLYLSVARTLAELLRTEDPEFAIRLLLRVLDRDGYDEPAHLNLAVALLRAGRHGEARRRYHLYRDRMTELDLPAVPFHELSAAVQPEPHRAAS